MIEHLLIWIFFILLFRKLRGKLVHWKSQRLKAENTKLELMLSYKKSHKTIANNLDDIKNCLMRMEVENNFVDKEDIGEGPYTSIYDNKPLFNIVYDEKLDEMRENWRNN